MKNSIEQAETILRGNDNGQRISEMYDRIKANRPVIDKAIQTRRFFAAGWFRLWRKDVLNKKVNRRDAQAFSNLRWLELRIV